LKKSGTFQGLFNGPQPAANSQLSSNRDRFPEDIRIASFEEADLINTTEGENRSE
jgi:hypothetical protein